jgi:hypothetical protein
MSERLALDVLRERADTLRWETRWRMKSGMLWACCLVVLSGWNIGHAGNAIEVLGNLVCAGGAVFLAWQWRRFRAPDARPAMGFMAAYRDDLLRQKRVAQVIGTWSLLPLVAGIALACAGHLAARHALHGMSFAVLAGLAAIMIGAAWLLGALAAQQVQIRIDEVDAALREGG